MANEFPEEGEFVLCTVMKIMGTTVFVNIEDYKKEGVVSTSEVAPGRIRNIRDYVTINKKIVCKVLRINKEKGTIDLSLRRVSQKETREVMDEYKKEHTAVLTLKLVLNEKALQAAEKIKEKYPSVTAFLESANKNPALLKDYFSKEESEKLSSLLKERIKEKKYVQKATLSISSTASNGISIIKDALMPAKNVTISYLGAPNYSISSEASDPKIAEKKLKDAIAEITAKLKVAGAKFEVKED